MSIGSTLWIDGYTGTTGPTPYQTTPPLYWARLYHLLVQEWSNGPLRRLLARPSNGGRLGSLIANPQDGSVVGAVGV